MIARISRPIFSERGTALLFALTVTSILFLLATSLAILTRSSTIVEVGHADTTQSFYYAEAGVNRGLAEFKNIFQGYNVPSGADFDPRNFTLNGTAVRYQLSAVAGYPQFVRIPAGKRYAGLNSIDYLYTNVSQTLAPDSTTKAQLGARSLIHSIPLFQFLAFYANDLEILPGANMTLHGRIHTNSSLYLNSDASLSILDQPLSANPRLITTVEVSASSNVYLSRKDASTCNGTVTIDSLATDPNTGDLAPLTLNCNGGAALTSTDTAPWLGSLSFAAPTLTVPPPSATIRGSTGTLDYWPKADLRIVLDLNPARRIQLGQVLGLSSNGNSGPGNGGSGSQGPLLDVIEVQNVDGSRNAAATTILWNFMLANPGKIFYTDVPSVANLATCYSACANSAASYNPPFQDYTQSSPSTADNDAMVYRTASDTSLSANWTANNGNGDNRLDYRRGAFFNNREKRGGQGTFVYLLNIDVQALLQWNMNQAANARLFDPSDRTEGGIVIFASVMNSAVNGGTPPQPSNYGVRVFDSSVLPFPAGFTNSADPTGVTVVTDQAVYVEGSYNINGPSGNPTWNPAAFIGDTLNVLSDNWENNGSNDAKSLLPLNSRRAVNTEINAAFIAGVDTTAVGNYNGGFENYPRFQEDWGGTTLTYLGSFVSLGNPTYANGPWCGTGGSCDISTGTCTGGTSGANNGKCNTYNPPARNWDYDGRFETAADLPPLNPQLVYAEQQLFDEQFN
jgi:hypothetical protein